MNLSGLRQMSLLNTPPRRRTPSLSQNSSKIAESKLNYLDDDENLTFNHDRVNQIQENVYDLAKRLAKEVVVLREELTNSTKSNMELSNENIVILIK